MTSSIVSLPTINTSSRTSKSSLDSPSHEAYRNFSYSNLDPPFGLDFSRDRSDIVLLNTRTEFDVDEDDESLSPMSPSTSFRSASVRSFSPVTGYRRGGPKEARLKKFAMISKTKEVEHLHPIKVKNIPETVKSDELAAHFSKFGKVEDVYIPTNLKTRKNRDFAVIRYADPKAVETILSTETDAESVCTLKLNDTKVTVSPLSKQPVFFTKGTGYLGITNEAFDDGTRSVSSKPPPQDVPLSSWFDLLPNAYSFNNYLLSNSYCSLSRSGAPWGSVHELKVLAPYGSIDALQKHAIKLTNLPSELTYCCCIASSLPATYSDDCYILCFQSGGDQGLFQ